MVGVLVLVSSGSISAADEVTLKAEYEAALKANRESESAITPLKATMQKADAAYAEAKKVADAKRQQATDANNLAGESGVTELKRAEDSLAAAIKVLTDAENAKPTLDTALADAEAAANPLRQSYDAADKAAKEAEGMAKSAAEVANKFDDEAKKAVAQAAAKRRVVDSAKGALARAQQAEQNFQSQIDTAPKKLGEAAAQKKAADDELAKANDQVAEAMTAYQSAEQAALAAESNAKPVSEAEKRQAGVDAAAKRKVADATKTALIHAWRNEVQSQAKANTAAKNLTDAPAQKKAAADELAKAKEQVAAATTAYQSSEQAALAAESNAKPVSEAEKKQAADDAAAKRKAADATKAALSQAQAQADTAALQLADQALQCSDAVVKAMADRAGRSKEENQKVAEEVVAKRKIADAAQMALTRAQQKKNQAQAQLNTVAKNLADAPAQEKAANEALTSARNQMVAATKAYQTAESEALAAETNAKVMAERHSRSKSQKEQATADVVPKRKAAATAKAALTQAQAAQKNLQHLADTAAQKLIRAEVQKNQAVAALASAKSQIADAIVISQAAEQAAQELEKLAERKSSEAAAAASKRKAAADAGAALTQAQQDEKQAQAQVATIAQKLAEAQVQKKSADETLANIKHQVAVAATASQTAGQTGQGDDAKAALAKAQQSEQQAQAQATTAAQKLTEVEAQKKANAEALAKAKNQVAAATSAAQSAQEAGKEVIQLDTVAKQAAADATAKRKAANEANEAKAALDPKARALEKTAVQANNAARELARAETRKKAAEEDLENLKKRIASAKQTFEADEKTAQAAEAAVVPLKEEAAKTRAAYTDATKVADDKRTLVEQAKTTLYQMVYARQVAKIMESTEPPSPANRIDEIVFAKLKALKIQPALCSDAVFVRRAYLDLTGMLPPAEEAKAFIQDSEKNKRVALIDRLLDRSEHADYWAMKWSDILKVKAEFPVKLWPNAAQAYHRWIWESLVRNKPYDQFVRELLTSDGSNFRDGPVNFYRAIQEKTPEGIAAAVGLAVMGTRVTLWPAERRADMAVFFSQIGYKPTSEWKEEIVFWDPLKSVTVPGSIAPGEDSIAKAVAATDMIPHGLTNALTEAGPMAAVFPDGTKTAIPPNRDPREVFADWLIRPGNPWFAKAIVNRTWAWAMGRGIIHEPDDIRENNPPSNPELLAYLEKELISSGYNLKKLKRLIFTSTTYQFSSIERSKAPAARANFASYQLRRVEAEVLIDELNEITGGSDLYTSAVPEPFTYIPHDMTAVELADGSVTSSFLTLFGRSSRAAGMESERVNELASTQCLHLLNSAAIQKKLQDGPKLAAIISQGGKTNEIAERLYLRILSRFPTDADLESAEEYTKNGATKGNGVWVDVAWALINSPEFLMRH